MLMVILNTAFDNNLCVNVGNFPYTSNRAPVVHFCHPDVVIYEFYGSSFFKVHLKIAMCFNNKICLRDLRQDVLLSMIIIKLKLFQSAFKNSNVF